MASKQDTHLAVRVMESCENGAQLLTAGKYLKEFSNLHPDDTEAISKVSEAFKRKSHEISHAESLRC